jgi:response regulator of citrate/malate metabolism
MAYFKNLLLLDDEDIDNTMHVYWANRFNLAENIITFTNPEKAIRYIQEHGFGSTRDLMIVDIHLPLMSGLEFLENIFSSCEPFSDQASVYVLTSSLSQRDLKRAGRLPLNGYLIKPLMEKDIREIIGAAGASA